MQLVAAIAAVFMAFDMTNPAVAKKRNASERNASDSRSIRVACMKQVGAYYYPGVGWQIVGGANTAQRSAFYDCLGRSGR